MLSLHTNNAALSAQNAISKTQSNLSTSQTRLSTGYRINSAMDDAAGLQIATRLKAQTSGMTVAMRNTQNSTSMLQTAEGALDEVSNILVRMKDLATQAADASSTVEDQKAMQGEYDALGKELSNIMKNTTFGGSKLLTDGTISKSMTFQIGATADENMVVDLSALMTALEGEAAEDLEGKGLQGLSATYVDPEVENGGAELFDKENYDFEDPSASTATAAAGATSARAAIDVIATALDSLGSVRSGLGAAANRLEHVHNNLSNISTNTKAATGLIMDVDFASESANMTSNQMLLQASTAMLKQANSQSSMVMSLLQ